MYTEQSRKIVGYDNQTKVMRRMHIAFQSIIDIDSQL